MKILTFLLLTLLSVNLSAAELSNDVETLVKKGHEYYDAEKYQESVPYFKKAAELGNEHAQFVLGNLYAFGKHMGITHDPEKGIKWMQKSAKKGYAPAMYYMGLFYQKSSGTEENLVQAYKWYLLASSQEYDDIHLQAKENMNKIKSELSEAQIQEATQLAMRWIENFIIPDVDVNKKYSLTVNVTPADSRIRIMNIKPKYQHGIHLEPGKYDVEVSKSGYETYRKWHEIKNENISLDINLKKKEQKSHSGIPNWTNHGGWVAFPEFCYYVNQVLDGELDCEQRTITEKSFLQYWAGDLTEVYYDAEADRPLYYKVRVTWITDRSPYSCGEIIQLNVNEIKSFKLRSIALTQCN